MRWLLIPLFLHALAAAAAAAAAPHAVPGSHLFILSGQSNMARLDAAAFFTPHVEARLGRGHVIVVKDAEGAQPIRRWLRPPDAPGGGDGMLYERLMGKLRAAVAGRHILTVTFIWMQGERDARTGRSKHYGRHLSRLLSQLEADLGRRDINVVIGRLSDFGLGRAEHRHWRRIRETQVAFAQSRSRGAWIDTDDLNDGRDARGRQVHNDLHLTPAGYRRLGERLALRALQLLSADRGGVIPVGSDAGAEGERR